VVASRSARPAGGVRPAVGQLELHQAADQGDEDEQDERGAGAQPLARLEDAQRRQDPAAGPRAGLRSRPGGRLGRLARRLLLDRRRGLHRRFRAALRRIRRPAAIDEAKGGPERIRRSVETGLP